MDLGLESRAAIVTGASRGIGRAVAEALVAEGCKVLVVARDADVLSDVVADLGHHRAAVLAADLTDPASAGLAVDRCLEVFGRLDVLVNNAGVAMPKAMGELTDADWQEGFALTFFAAARMAGACAPVMREAGWGRMVHVASISGREPDPTFAPYSAAKAALLNLSTSLSQAYGADGVLSSCVVPGVTLTELVAANAASTALRHGTTSEEVMARMLARHRVPTGRFGTPSEVAAAVVFLASEAAGWISGATLEVDGGTLRSV